MIRLYGDPPTNPVPTTETRGGKGEKGEKI